MNIPFNRTRLEPEAFHAYLSRLPERVDVAWKKEGELIVGKVGVDGFTFATQGRDVAEFIRMVNEGVLIAFDTPSEYIGPIAENINYAPPTEDFENLVRASSGQLNGKLQIDRSEAFA